jgi:hypothetical protein
MRGHRERIGSLFSYVSIEGIPAWVPGIQGIFIFRLNIIMACNWIFCY